MLFVPWICNDNRDQTIKLLSTSKAPIVMGHLELQGLLNDLEFARLWSESRQRQKKLSKRIIGQELRTKGVSQDIIDEVISDIDENVLPELQDL